ncbi:MAG: sigma-54 dependent transcriptional regulator [Rhizobiaceae bacterium]
MADCILIVDDDPVQRRLLSGMIGKMGHTTLLAEGGAEAIDLLSGKDAASISLIFLDLVMPKVGGMAVLAAMAEKQITIPAIVQTAQGGIETAVDAMRAGAFDFVVKPISPERVKVAITNALKVGASQVEHKRTIKAETGTMTFNDIISASPNMARVKLFGEKSARSNIPVLIEGESGVGKELVARAIQGVSARCSQNFVTVNCGALPENLVESILFGHEKGAFTGANEKQIGKFREANGGTLFLDEVGELPLDVQVKLLRAIQEGEIDPVGSRKSVKVDIRLISATNRNLADEVDAGNFREDLFYRLNVFPILVPPLRERSEDIPELARHFTRELAAQENRKNIKSITPHAIELLAAYDWPGNIRQLENAIFRAVVLCETDALTLDEFPQILAQVGKFEPNTEPNAEKVAKVSAQKIAETPVASTTVETSSPKDSLSLTNDTGEIRDLAEIERDVIRFALELYDGKMSKISRELGIGRSTLYRKLKEYGLDEDADEEKLAG